MSNSVGQYSVSISFSLPWKKEKPKITDKKRKKTLKPIVNPIFEKCADLTADIFWKSILMDCARGKFPRGFSFKNNLLSHKKGSRVTTLEVNKSATDTLVGTINFFQSVAGIMSATDREKLQQKEEEKILAALGIRR